MPSFISCRPLTTARRDPPTAHNRDVNMPPEAAARRKLLGVAFWLVFISTPAALISMPALFEHFPRLNLLEDYSLIVAAVSLLAGSLTAAFLLAMFLEKSHWQLVRYTIGFSLLFAFVFGFITLGGWMIT